MLAVEGGGRDPGAMETRERGGIPEGDREGFVGDGGKEVLSPPVKLREPVRLELREDPREEEREALSVESMLVLRVEEGESSYDISGSEIRLSIGILSCESPLVLSPSVSGLWCARACCGACCCACWGGCLPTTKEGRRGC